MGGQGYGIGETLSVGTTGGIQAPRSRALYQGTRVAEAGSGGSKSPPGTLRGTAREDPGLSTAAPGDPSDDLSLS